MEHVSHQDYESDVVFVVNTKTQDRRTGAIHTAQRQTRPDRATDRASHTDKSLRRFAGWLRSLARGGGSGSGNKVLGRALAVQIDP